ncbi:hypothetical protein [Corynebacterium imitans]|uniref:hypothetical protein n=1 Tax=Corynebacterium imitans TaxID=156978 RepID=UPI001E53FDC7|nr:hypothetical protein [Corynebacterium imitans]
MKPATVLIGRREDDEHRADILVLLARARGRFNLYQVGPSGKTIETNLALFVADA